LGTIDLFKQGYLLGLGEFFPGRFPAGPAEAAAVLGTALAVLAVRTFSSFISCRLIGRDTNLFER
jgi:hypothetical protein